MPPADAPPWVERLRRMADRLPRNIDRAEARGAADYLESLERSHARYVAADAEARRAELVNEGEERS